MKKKKFISLFVFSTVVILFFNNNYFLYSDPILKITSIENITNDNSEKYTQLITGDILNGEYKNQTFTFSYETSFSELYTENFDIADNLFVKINSNENSISSVTGVKRDNYIAFLFVIFIDLLILIVGIKGLKTLFSLVFNVILSVIFINLYISNYLSFNFLLLFILLSLIFIFSSLIIPNGFNKKSLCAITSTIISITISFIISYLLLNIFGNELYYYTMDYVDVVSDYKSVFYVIVLLSGLGAIMDIAITLSSAINELKVKNDNIDNDNLKKSGKIISKDILGTMLNVLIYTSFVSVIPTIILVLKNNMTFLNAIDIYGQIQIVIILTSILSVIISIPVSLHTSLYFFRRKHD